MAQEDSKAAFLQIPWTASLLQRPNVICRVPETRRYKASTEDSLFAETLKTPRTLPLCLIFYERPPAEQEWIQEVHTLYTLGDGMSGHPDLLHGGLIAAIIDDGMGHLPASNYEWRHMKSVSQGKAEGELPPQENPSYTAELNIKFLAPVKTPGAVMLTARYIKREGRKHWVHAEIRQPGNLEEDYDGKEVVCATGEALFIAPRKKETKL